MLWSQHFKFWKRSLASNCEGYLSLVGEVVELFNFSPLYRNASSMFRELAYRKARFLHLTKCRGCGRRASIWTTRRTRLIFVRPPPVAIALL
jgi:hypothetical protein